MSRNRWSPALVAGLLVSACFHQIVQTGRAPGPTVIEKPWVSTWIFGLVAAQPIDVRQQCPSGVATVETQQSFANGLVGALTLGIWDPQTVKITCAAAGGSPSPAPAGAIEVLIPKTATHDQGIDIENAAIATSVRTHRTVVLRF
jgi:hypothetical protein